MVSRTNGKPDSFHRIEKLTGRNSVCLFQFLFPSPGDTSPVWKHRDGSVEYAMITKTAESPQYFCCFVHWTPTLHRLFMWYAILVPTVCPAWLLYWGGGVEAKRHHLPPLPPPPMVCGLLGEAERRGSSPHLTSPCLRRRHKCSELTATGSNWRKSLKEIMFSALIWTGSQWVPNYVAPRRCYTTVYKKKSLYVVRSFHLGIGESLFSRVQGNSPHALLLPPPFEHTVQVYAHIVGRAAGIARIFGWGRRHREGISAFFPASFYGRAVFKARILLTLKL